jgi:hypothetical protein
VLPTPVSSRDPKALADLASKCEKAASDNAPKAKNPGRGTMNDPYAFNYAAPLQLGFTLKVTTFLANADRQVRQANMFNKRPKADEKYVMIGVEVTCLDSRSEPCKTNYLDYSLSVMSA